MVLIFFLYYRDSNGLFSPDSNAPMINLSLNNRKKGPNHMRYGGYEYFKKNNGAKADLFIAKTSILAAATAV